MTKLANQLKGEKREQDRSVEGFMVARLSVRRGSSILACAGVTVCLLPSSLPEFDGSVPRGTG